MYVGFREAGLGTFWLQRCLTVFLGSKYRFSGSNQIIIIELVKKST